MNPEQLRDLVRYRLEQASETLAQAQPIWTGILMDESQRHMHPRGNRVFLRDASPRTWLMPALTMRGSMATCPIMNR